MSQITANWLGASLPRREDVRLIQGRGAYLDDLEMPGAVHLAMVRSAAPHAALSQISGADVTGWDLPSSVNRLPVLYRSGQAKQLEYPVLPTDVVRYVGQPVACCWAQSRYEAEDKAAAVVVSYGESHPAVTSAREADAGHTLLYPEWGTNVAAVLDYTAGDEPGRLAGLQADRFQVHFGRSQGVPMEGRGVLAKWDAGRERLLLWSSTQAPSQFRSVIARVLGLAETAVQVITPDVGGGFGNKLHIFPEDVLAAWLSMRLGRPVKWVEDRSEHFLGNVHARDASADVAVYHDDTGRVYGLEARVLVDVGAHLHTKGMGPASNVGKMITGGYRIPHLRAQVLALVTNKVPNGAYRGFGQPEAAFIIERAMDIVARACGMDPVEVRQRNLLRPEELPCTTPTGQHLDNGDYPGALAGAVAAFDMAAFRARQTAALRAGRYLGVGTSCFLEIGGSAPSQALGKLGRNQGGYEHAVLRVEPSGDIVLHLGVVDQGQGHATIFSQLAASVLGCDPAAIAVRAGDTDRDPYSGYGTASSRCTVVAGSAVLGAAEKLKRKILDLSALLLEVSVEDIEFTGDRVQVKGVPTRGLDLSDIAAAAYSGHRLPPGTDAGLEAHMVYDPPDWTYSYGASAVEVEVDPGTGRVRVQRYVMVHDAGKLVNPRLAEGQTVGGIMQGIGGALLEEHVYDDGGQLISGTFKDYLLPSIDEVPVMEIHHLETPSPFTPGGMKGLGEGGTIAPAPAIVQAVEDALGIQGLNTVPLTPPRVLTAWMEKTRGHA